MERAAESNRVAQISGNMFDYVDLFRALTRDIEATETSSDKIGVEEVLERYLERIGLEENKPLTSIAKHLNVGDPGNLPLDWSAFISRDQSNYLGGGGSADVWKASWKIERFAGIELPNSLPQIAVKRFRPIKAGLKTKFVLREITVWHKLEHENVVRFVGIVHDDSWAPCLVSEYIERGSVVKYLKSEPEVCVRQLIIGICAGLKYLHDFKPAIIHGDIKPDNILVRSSGQPCLCDFGLSRILIENTLWNTSAIEARGTRRWMAPELIDDGEVRPTMASDVYAFALCCFELITGMLPLETLQNDVQIITAVVKNKLPVMTWPEHLVIPTEVKEIISQGWSFKPMPRPTLSMVSNALYLSCCKDGLSEKCIANPFKDKIERIIDLPSWPNWTRSLPPISVETHVLERNALTRENINDKMHSPPHPHKKKGKIMAWAGRELGAAGSSDSSAYKEDIHLE